MKRNYILDALAVPILIILGKLITFIFDAILAAYYGAGSITDAFVMAHALPTILFDGVANAIVVCFIPVYQNLKKKEASSNEVDKYCNNSLTIAILLGVLVSSAFTVCYRSILSVYARGFSGESYAYLRVFSLIMIWAIPFIAAYSVLRAYLQSNEAKSIGCVTQIITYLVLIGTTILFYPNSVALAYATVAGNLLVFLFMYFVCVRKGWVYSPYIDLKDKNIRILFISIVPIFMSSLLGEINAIVDKYFSSFYAAGIVTSMSYGYKLSFAIQGIVASSIMIILYPELAECAAKNDIRGIRTRNDVAIKMITYIVYPIVFGSILFANIIIQCVYGHGKFDVNSVEVTAKVFGLYSLGVVPMCVKHVGDKVCYALQKPQYTLYTSVISVISNVILNYVLSIKFGYIGLVAATGISILIGCVCIYILIFRYDRRLVDIRAFFMIIQPMLPAAIMSMLLLFINRVWLNYYKGNVYLYLLLNIIFGMIFYSILLVIFCKKDINSMIMYLRRKLKGI